MIIPELYHGGRTEVYLKNEIEKEFAKLMQNGLYGKFAQKNKHLVLESYDTLKEIEVFKNDNDRINFK